jgi:hypothetical protein
VTKCLVFRLKSRFFGFGNMATRLESGDKKPEFRRDDRGKAALEAAGDELMNARFHRDFRVNRARRQKRFRARTGRWSGDRVEIRTVPLPQASAG